MIWLRLYDPGRTPPHWSDIVVPGQYAVFVADARTRSPRNADGQPFRDAAGAETGVCAALCEDLAEAKQFALDVVTRHPELSCEIYDHQGKSNPPLQTFYNPATRHKYAGRRYGRRLAIAGGALAGVGCVLVLIELSRGFTWIWGYVLGLKCMLVGGTLLTTGLLEWYAHRTERDPRR